MPRDFRHGLLDNDLLLVDLASVAAAFVDPNLVGVVIMDREARIRRANNRARKFLASDRGLVQRGGRLAVDAERSADSEDEENLKKLLAAAAKGVPGGSAVVGSNAPQRSLTVCANPVVGYVVDENRIPVPRAHIVALIVDPWRSPNVNPSWLEASLGLTSCTSWVVSRLVAGLTPAGITETVKCTIDGIRHHIKQARVRTGSDRYSDLVRLALSASRVPVPGSESE